MRNNLGTLLFAGALIFTSVAQAGVIYTDEASFLAATSGFSTAWSEDFESFSLGAAVDPLTIGAGAAEVVDGNNSQIWNFTPGGDNAWLQAGVTLANATLRGVGNTALGLGAFSFEFANQDTGTWDFLTSLGVTSSAVYAAGGDQDRNFLGWVGGAGETLTSTSFSAQNGIVLDDINAYSSVPEPNILILLSLSLLGMGLTRRKRLS